MGVKHELPAAAVVRSSQTTPLNWKPVPEFIGILNRQLTRAAAPTAHAISSRASRDCHNSQRVDVVPPLDTPLAPRQTCSCLAGSLVAQLRRSHPWHKKPMKPPHVAAFRIPREPLRDGGATYAQFRCNATQRSSWHSCQFQSAVDAILFAATRSTLSRKHS